MKNKENKEKGKNEIVYFIIYFFFIKKFKNKIKDSLGKKSEKVIF
jgi:hypothetical protein